MRLFTLLMAALLAPVLSLASDYADSVLTNLTGVGLEVRSLNVQSEVFDLSFEMVESEALNALKEFDVRLLSQMEMDVMPGQPYLDISIEVAHAQGPSHLYVVQLELREMAKLDRPRDRVVSMSLPTWERRVMGVANRPEAITIELKRLLRIFADDYHSANRPE